MHYVALMLLFFVTPVWADDADDSSEDAPPTVYVLPDSGLPIVPSQPSGTPYVAPSTGNVYIPIAPNTVIDTTTGQTVPVN